MRDCKGSCPYSVSLAPFFFRPHESLDRHTEARVASSALKSIIVHDVAPRYLYPFCKVHSHGSFVVEIPAWQKAHEVEGLITGLHPWPLMRVRHQWETTASAPVSNVNLCLRVTVMRPVVSCGGLRMRTPARPAACLSCTANAPRFRSQCPPYRRWHQQAGSRPCLVHYPSQAAQSKIEANTFFSLKNLKASTAVAFLHENI